jgi:hypothetical protein
MELRNRQLPAHASPGSPASAYTTGFTMHPALQGSPAAWQQQQSMGQHAMAQHAQHSHHAQMAQQQQVMWQQMAWRQQQQQLLQQHQMMVAHHHMQSHAAHAHMSAQQMHSPSASMGMNSPAPGLHPPFFGSPAHMSPGMHHQPPPMPGVMPNPAVAPGTPGSTQLTAAPAQAEQPKAAPGGGMAPAPAPAATAAVPTRYRARIPGLVRAAYARDSEPLGALEAGTIIDVLESRTNEQGQQRVRFVYRNGREGWTSVVSAAGQVILEPQPAAGAGPAAGPAAAAGTAARGGGEAEPEVAGMFPRVVAQIIDNGFMLILSCILLGDLAFEATTGASSELAGTFGVALLGGGRGRPVSTPDHVHEFFQSVSALMGVLQQ